MEGRLFSWAMAERREPFITEKALEEPPSIVGIEEVIMHFMPLYIVSHVIPGGST